MKPLNSILEIRHTSLAKLERLNWLPPLLIRLFVGYFFVETGLGKVQNLDAMTQRFIEWGIPAPAFNAALSGFTELIGGSLIMLGLFTRLTCIPMLINMVVAVLSVKLKRVAGLDDFVELDEPLYALFFLSLMFTGAGRISLDALLLRLCQGSSDDGIRMTSDRNERATSVARAG